MAGGAQTQILTAGGAHPPTLLLGSTAANHQPVGRPHRLPNKRLARGEEPGGLRRICRGRPLWEMAANGVAPVRGVDV
eukprot:11202106-Lingulodinium_polyedra.AAC.1